MSVMMMMMVVVTSVASAMVNGHATQVSFGVAVGPVVGSLDPSAIVRRPRLFRQQMMDFGIRQVLGRWIVDQFTDVQIPSRILSSVLIISRVVAQDASHGFGLDWYGGFVVPVHILHGVLLLQSAKCLQNLGLVRFVIADQTRSDVAVINLLELVADFDVVYTTEDVFYADHGVVDQLFVNALVHGFLEFVSPFDFE